MFTKTLLICIHLLCCCCKWNSVQNIQETGTESVTENGLFKENWTEQKPKLTVLNGIRMGIVV